MGRKGRRGAARRPRSRDPGPSESTGSVATRRWRIPLLLGLAAVVAVGVLLRGGPSAGSSDPPALAPLPPPSAHDSETVAYADFLGAEACAECHGDSYRRWRGSTHGRAGGEPGPGAVVAPFDGRGIELLDARVTPIVHGAEYAFVVDHGHAPPDTLWVAAVVGGGHMAGGGTQAFFTELPDGTLGLLPFDWSASDGVWFCNAGGSWLPLNSELPLTACSDWPPTRMLGSSRDRVNCQQCHGSQIAASFDPDERRYRTRFTTLRVDCEACHGPGRRHVERIRSGANERSADIGMQALGTLPEDSSIQVCLRCHGSKQPVGAEPPPERPDGPAGWLPGEPFEPRWSLLLPLMTDRPFFPDNRVRTFAYQLNHLGSDCYLSGTMTCTDCHDPHSQHYRDIAWSPLPGRLDDGQCLDCHPSKAADPTGHTRHPPGSAGSRCVSCHMPYLQHPSVGERVTYARSDHSVSIPRPELDARLGIAGACAGCHRERSPEELTQEVRDWWGETKPPPPLVTAMLGAGSLPDRVSWARALLRPGDDFPMAQATALGAFLLRWVDPDGPALEPDVEQRLRALAGSRDPDVAAMALAGLHAAAGHEADTRRFLSAKLEDLGPDPRGVRARWVESLRLIGDGLRFRRNAGGAAVVYGRALELAPSDARTLEAVGTAWLDLRRWDEAEAAFRQALLADPGHARGGVQLGYALGGRGDVAGALRAFSEAATRNPWDPGPALAAGRVLLQIGRTEDAAESFRRALTLSPRLTDARLGLARALAAEGATAEARAQVDTALAYDPGSQAARRALEMLAPLGAEGDPGRRAPSPVQP